jgi:hypothetical protein
MLIFDTESDGLLYAKNGKPPATKLHIMGWTTDGETYRTTTVPEKMCNVLDEYDMAGCHNSFRHDFPLLEKLYGYKYTGLKVDTLFLSWTLFPREPQHGLGYWGEKFGVPKVGVDEDQWIDPDMTLMRERVIEDVKINWKLWKKQKQILEGLYT